MLGGACLFLTLILIAGLVAALDGPAFPGRDSPVLQHNLDGPGQRRPVALATANASGELLAEQQAALDSIVIDP